MTESNPLEIARHLRDINMPDGDVRVRAAKALVAIGSPAVPDLIDALDSEGFFTARYAARILGEIGDPRAVTPLIDRLRLVGHGHSDDSQAFASSLVRIARRNPVPELRDAVPLLESKWTRLSDAGASVRNALARLPETASGTDAAAIAAATDADQRARSLIDQLGPLFLFWRDGTRRALIALGAPAVLPLIEVLRWSPDVGVQARAADILCEIGDPRAVAALLTTLREMSGEDDSATRDRMAKRIEAMPLPKDVGADPVFTRPLIAALVWPNKTASWVAFNLLVAAGPPAVPALVATLGGTRPKNKKQHRAIVLVLGYIGAPDAASALRDACADADANVRHAAIAALGRIQAVRPADIPMLIQALGDEAKWVRAQAAGGLGTLASGAAPPPPELRAALPPLRRLLRSPFTPDAVRNACQPALEKIEAATAAFKDLPMPASAAVSPDSAEGLPVPTAPPVDRSSANLPLPVATADRPEPRMHDKRSPWWQRLRRRFFAR